MIVANNKGEDLKSRRRSGKQQSINGGSHGADNTNWNTDR